MNMYVCTFGAVNWISDRLQKFACKSGCFTKAAKRIAEAGKPQ